MERARELDDDKEVGRQTSNWEERERVMKTKTSEICIEYFSSTLV